MLTSQYSELFDNYSIMFSFLVVTTLKQVNLSDKFGILMYYVVRDTVQ